MPCRAAYVLYRVPWVRGTPGDDKISEEEFALYFSKVMKVETAHAKALFRVADATRDGFLEYREFLGLMAILYRHLL